VTDSVSVFEALLEAEPEEETVGEMEFVAEVDVVRVDETVSVSVPLAVTGCVALFVLEVCCEMVTERVELADILRVSVLDVVTEWDAVNDCDSLVEAELEIVDVIDNVMELLLELVIEDSPVVLCENVLESDLERVTEPGSVNDGDGDMDDVAVTVTVALRVKLAEGEIVLEPDRVAVKPDRVTVPDAECDPELLDDLDLVRLTEAVGDAATDAEIVSVTDGVELPLPVCVLAMLRVTELLPDDVVLRVAVADDDIVMVPIVAVEVRDGDMVDETDTDTEALVVPLRVDVKEMNVILSEVSVKLRTEAVPVVAERVNVGSFPLTDLDVREPVTELV
jgi:hypothetical protein